MRKTTKGTVNKRKVSKKAVNKPQKTALRKLNAKLNPSLGRAGLSTIKTATASPAQIALSKAKEKVVPKKKVKYKQSIPRPDGNVQKRTVVTKNKSKKNVVSLRKQRLENTNGKTIRRYKKAKIKTRK